MNPIRLAFASIALATLAACTTPPAAMPPAVTAPAGWTLAWSDEFDGVRLDPGKWVAETGGHGWGNKELQHYTGRPENLRLEDGKLVIEARRERYEGSDYTSARIKTAGLMEQLHDQMHPILLIHLLQLLDYLLNPKSLFLRYLQFSCC